MCVTSCHTQNMNERLLRFCHCSPVRKENLQHSQALFFLLQASRGFTFVKHAPSNRASALKRFKRIRREHPSRSGLQSGFTDLAVGRKGGYFNALKCVLMIFQYKCQMISERRKANCTIALFARILRFKACRLLGNREYHLCI